MKRLSACALLAGACAIPLLACNEAVSPPQATPPQVTVVIARTESVPLTLESVGLLAPTRVAELRARVAGVVLKQVYTEGSDVEQGQALFQIDPAPLEAALRAEEAALARARADASNATLIAKRSQDLAAKGLLASQDLDTALANQRTTAAAVKEAQANVEKAQLDLKYATVTAPIAGHAGRALVTEGALVGQDEATQLTTVEQIDPIYVNFSQSVSELQQLRQAVAGSHTGSHSNRDTQVEVILPDGTTYPRPGRLDFSDLAVDQRTGAVSLRAVMPNPERQLLPGMFVKLHVTMGHLDHAFLLPQATVLRDGTGPYVLVVAGDGKVEQRRVQTQGMTQTDWIVSGDLADGDQVIVDGLQKASPGAMAVAVPAASPDKNQTPPATPAAGS
jgi:membrane fusion protein (multidrug efflux system)